MTTIDAPALTVEAEARVAAVLELQRETDARLAQLYKLRDDAICELRTSGVSPDVIAAALGISRGRVSQIWLERQGTAGQHRHWTKPKARPADRSG